jgi:antitoxin component YwqK of YwqJK toxin-antitoxin module
MSTLLLSSLLWGCSGGGVEVPLDGPAEPAAKAPFTCPEGSKLNQTTTGTGSEQFCDRDGVMQGPYLRIYPDGETKAARGAYDRSAPDGDWTWWHENGEEAQKGKYVKGKQVGAWTRWYQSGKREEEGDYLSGRKAGQWTTFYESGHKQAAGIYQNDMKNGMWTYWFDDEEGTVERTELWEGGIVKEEKIINKAPPEKKEP